jgi:hypothetical protein
MVVVSSSVPEIREKILEVLQPLGFEVRPFLVGWYNGQERQEPQGIRLKIIKVTFSISRHSVF